jgi:hypothetical protein
LEESDLEDLDEDLDSENFDSEALDLEASGLALPDLAASGWAGVSADAGNPVTSAKLVAPAIRANDKRIDRAVHGRAARLGWVTAFLRGESSIPLGTRSI